MLIILNYNCVQRAKVLKHVNSRIYEHISGHLDYFRIHISHLAAQGLVVKNDIIKGKGKAPATQNQFL